MAVTFPLAKMRGLSRKGIPADAPSGAPDNEYVLDVQGITNLISTPELFFEVNPSFVPLKPVADKALKALLRAGIISYAGQKPKRKGGCGGCARRKLYAFAIQFANRFQMLVLRAQKDPEAKEKLEKDLRAYLVRKSTDLKPGMPIVFYPRLKNGKVRKVVL